MPQAFVMGSEWLAMGDAVGDRFDAACGVAMHQSDRPVRAFVKLVGVSQLSTCFVLTNPMDKHILVERDKVVGPQRHEICSRAASISSSVSSPGQSLARAVGHRNIENFNTAVLFYRGGLDLDPR